MMIRLVCGLPLFAAVLVGCAVMPPAHVAPTEPPAEAAMIVEPSAPVTPVRQPPGDVEQLLIHFERIKRMPSGELAKEHEAARNNYGRTGSDFNRLGYAIVLSLPGTAFMDDTRALDLLDPIVKRGEASLRSLAIVLVTFIQERRRIAGDLGAAQQKLDALRSLERSLIERDQNNPGRK